MTDPLIPIWQEVVVGAGAYESPAAETGPTLRRPDPDAIHVTREVEQ